MGLFSGLFGRDPEQVAFERKMRFNTAIRSLEKHIAKTNGILAQRMKVAVAAKRTGDAIGYKQAKAAMATSIRTRKLAERKLHNLQLVSIRVEEAKLNKVFVGVMQDMAETVKDVVSAEEIRATMADMDRAMEQIKQSEELMDGMIDHLEDGLSDAVQEGAETAPEIDRAIEQMIAEKDNLTEDRIASILAAETAKV